VQQLQLATHHQGLCGSVHQHAQLAAPGLAVQDPVYLHDATGVTLLDTYTFPVEAGDGVSVERVDLDVGDTEKDWAASE